MLSVNLLNVTSSFGRVDVTSSLVIPRYSSTPSLGTGSIYFNTSDNTLYVSSGTSWIAGGGSSGTSGARGTSGTAGVGGSSGTAGSSGAAGSSGTAGSSGAAGSSGTAGSSGAAGSSGTAGSSGAAGSSGTSGVTGVPGSSGTAGRDGTSGSSGASGAAGSSGTAGRDGTSGSSGASGAAGSSGTSGVGSPGTSGTSGVGSPGTSGTSGIGFNTINNAAVNRILLSDGTTNAATASSNLTYSGATFSVTGSTFLSASGGSTALTVQGSGSVNPIFKVEGSTGTLFAITEATAGSLFSVTNGSGLIMFDVNSSATASFSSSLNLFSSGSAITREAKPMLTLSHLTTGTPLVNFGVGIDFRGEDGGGTLNQQIGTLEYRWDKVTAGDLWGKFEVKLSRGSQLTGSKMILPGVENSFGGTSRYTAVNTTFGDSAGVYPNYRIYAYGETTDATQTRLTFGTNSSPTVLVPPIDSTWMFSAYVVARRTDADNESAGYWIRGVIDNNGGVIAIVPSNNQLSVEDSAWDATITDDAGSGLVIFVTGENAKTIRWNAYVDIVQVVG